MKTDSRYMHMNNYFQHCCLLSVKTGSAFNIGTASNSCNVAVKMADLITVAQTRAIEPTNN